MKPKRKKPSILKPGDSIITAYAASAPNPSCCDREVKRSAGDLWKELREAAARGEGA